MESRATGQIKNKWFPLGIYIRILFAIIALLLSIADVIFGVYTTSNIESLWGLIVGYLPMLLLAFGVIPGIYGWFLSYITISVFYNDLPDMWAALLLSAATIPLYCTYLASTIKIIVFGIISLTVFIIEFLLTGQLMPVQFLVFFIASFSYGVGFLLRHFRIRHEESKQRIQDLQDAQRRARKEERTRLAHELHDIVAHEVTVIAMQARRAQFVKDSQQTERILTGIGDSASQALDDLRKLVSVLKAADSEDAQERGTPNAASSFASSTQLLDENDLSGETTTAVALTHDLHRIAEALENAGFNVTLDITGDMNTAPATLRQVLRRTAREFGTNILKHGSTQHPVHLSLFINDAEVALTSSNTVSAEKPISSTQIGLESIKARFDALGGTAAFDHTNGEWSIRVALPLSQ